MSLPSYEEKEAEFLEAMATRFGFNGKNRLIFLKRFQEKNANSTSKDIADCYETELIEGTKNGDSDRIFRQQLSAICDKLKNEGCDFNGTTKGKWQIAKCWLREEIFPQWAKEQGLIDSPSFTFEQLWEKLREIATPTEKMVPVLAGVTTLAMVPSQKRDRKTVPVNSDIIFEVNLDSPGYLLLERSPSGEVFCLCPSEYAPDLRFAAGRAVLPQPGAPDPTFCPDEVGCEQILAVIAKELPNLGWLSQGNGEVLQLDKEHINGLLEYVERTPDCQVLYSEYQVTLS